MRWGQPRLRRNATPRAAPGTPHLLVAARLQRLPQTANVHVDRPVLDEHVISPDFIQQLSAAVHPIRVCHQKMQRSEEHTSELQSQSNLVCRLLLGKKKRGLHPPAGQSSLFFFLNDAPTPKTSPFPPHAPLPIFFWWPPACSACRRRRMCTSTVRSSTNT